jgi:hypothetical protein
MHKQVVLLSRALLAISQEILSLAMLHLPQKQNSHPEGRPSVLCALQSALAFALPVDEIAESGG